MSLSLKKQKRLIEQAKILSPLCQERCRHIAFILKRNKVLSVGWNQKQTDAFAARQHYKYPYKHAEFMAIRNFKYNLEELSGMDIVSLRISRDNKRLLYAKPCTGCLHFIRQLGFKNIYYSTDNNKIRILQ